MQDILNFGSEAMMSSKQIDVLKQHGTGKYLQYPAERCGKLSVVRAKNLRAKIWFEAGLIQFKGKIRISDGHFRMFSPIGLG